MCERWNARRSVLFVVEENSDAVQQNLFLPGREAPRLHRRSSPARVRAVHDEDHRLSHSRTRPSGGRCRLALSGLIKNPSLFASFLRQRPATRRPSATGPGLPLPSVYLAGTFARRRGDFLYPYSGRDRPRSGRSATAIFGDDGCRPHATLWSRPSPFLACNSRERNAARMAGLRIDMAFNLPLVSTMQASVGPSSMDTHDTLTSLRPNVTLGYRGDGTSMQGRATRIHRNRSRPRARRPWKSSGWDAQSALRGCHYLLVISPLEGRRMVSVTVRPRAASSRRRIA